MTTLAQDTVSHLAKFELFVLVLADGGEKEHQLAVVCVSNNITFCPILYQITGIALLFTIYLLTGITWQIVKEGKG